MIENLYGNIKNKKAKISIIGLGYVGLPLAIEFAKRGLSVIGFDNDKAKIGLYKEGLDPTREVGDETVRNSNVEFTSDPTMLKRAKFHIVAVPTPVNDDHTPFLLPVENASRILGENLVEGSVVVYESTVYPGVTEEFCVPVLEKNSGMICGRDFKVGYSPERINPGDKVHRLSTIVKIVSGQDIETLNLISKIYSIVVDAGVYQAESIKVAEAAKVIENSQRDINIAFVNELSLIFHKMGIDTKEVLAAAGTKWNFLKFTPGLVGGHCIGVDPYYLTYKAERLGYQSQVISAGRRINDGMGIFVAQSCVKMLIKAGRTVKDARVAVLGFSFKENCPDTRNTKVIDIIRELREFGINPFVYDPEADAEEAEKLYGISFCSYCDITKCYAVIVAVAHDLFSNMTIIDMDKLFDQGSKVIIDVKGVLDKSAFIEAGYQYWRL